MPLSGSMRGGNPWNAANAALEARLAELRLTQVQLNARDAMPTGGTRTVAARRESLDEAYCRTHLDATPGPHVALRVEDTGVGMAASIREHHFEPFFTTKPEGRGTGLGLPMVCGIVGNHGGHVTVESHEGQGTLVTACRPGP